MSAADWENYEAGRLTEDEFAVLEVLLLRGEIPFKRRAKEFRNVSVSGSLFNRRSCLRCRNIFRINRAEEA